MQTECPINQECLFQRTKESSLRGLTKVIFSQYERLFQADGLGQALICKSAEFGKTNSFSPPNGAFSIKEKEVWGGNFLLVVLEEAAHLAHHEANPELENILRSMREAMFAEGTSQAEKNSLFAEKARVISGLEFVAMLALLSFLFDKEAQTALAQIMGKPLQETSQKMMNLGKRQLLQLQTSDYQELDIYGRNLPYTESYSTLWHYWKIMGGSELPMLATLSTEELRVHVAEIIGTEIADKYHRKFESALAETANSGFWMLPFMSGYAD